MKFNEHPQLKLSSELAKKNSRVVGDGFDDE
jgi:chaperonin GroEL (HSP60 family)